MLKINSIIGQINTGRFEDSLEYLSKKTKISYFGYSSPFANDLIVKIYQENNQKLISLNFLKIFNFFKLFYVSLYFLSLFIVFSLSFKVKDKRILAISTFATLISFIKSKIYFGKNQNTEINYYCLDYYLNNKNSSNYEIVFSKIFIFFDSFLSKRVTNVIDITKRITDIRNKINKNNLDSLELNLGYRSSISYIKNKTQSAKKENSLIFFGTHSSNQNFELIIEIFELINELEEYKLIICGMGPETNKFKNIIKKSKYKKNIIFKGFVKETELIKLIEKSKFSFGLWKNIENDNSLFADPGKVKLSILLETPCILSDHIFSVDIFSDKCGPVISQNFDRNKILNIFSNKNLYDSYINNCRKMKYECVFDYHFEKIFI